jgi:glutamine cyclotransferase
MSDGTNTLTFLNPNTLQVTKTLAVSENGYAKDYLNELEFIDGFIYANVWGTTRIAKIDINTGYVLGEINLLSLAQDAYYNYPGSLEMNGIAYDSIEDVMYITGKMWPKVYQIKLD